MWFFCTFLPETAHSLHKDALELKKIVHRLFSQFKDPFIAFHLVNVGGNIIWTNATSKGLSEATDKSNASAVIQFINMGCGTIGVFLIEVVPPTATMLLPVAFGIAVILMFATWLKLRAHRKG